jgi:hypothetical protein
VSSATDAEILALAAIYTAIGWECAARLDCDRYERLADGVGNIGLMSLLVQRIKQPCDFVMNDMREYPGAWLYEIAHAWGIYLFNHWEEINDENFLVYAQRMIDKWIETDGATFDPD